MIEKTKCKASGKARYNTYGEAKEDMIRKKSHNKRRVSVSGIRVKRGGFKNVLKRPYYCKYCGGYHLTSKDLFTSKNPIKEKQDAFYKNFDINEWKKNSLPFPED